MMAAVAFVLTEEASPTRPGSSASGRLRHPLGERAAAAGAAVVGGALVKATGAVLLPFMLLARRNWRSAAGAAGALVFVAAVSYPVFGLHGLDVVSALNRDAALVSTDSFATEIAHLLGKPGVFPVDHALLKVALVVIVAHLMWRTWRGYDWVAASGWALLAIAVTSTWLLAWYTLWTLPLAAIARDRRLLIATFAVQALFIPIRPLRCSPRCHECGAASGVADRCGGGRMPATTGRRGMSGGAAPNVGADGRWARLPERLRPCERERRGDLRRVESTLLVLVGCWCSGWRPSTTWCARSTSTIA